MIETVLPLTGLYSEPGIFLRRQCPIVFLEECAERAGLCRRQRVGHHNNVCSVCRGDMPTGLFWSSVEPTGPMIPVTDGQLRQLRDRLQETIEKGEITRNRDGYHTFPVEWCQIQSSDWRLGPEGDEGHGDKCPTCNWRTEPEEVTFMARKEIGKWRGASTCGCSGSLSSQDFDSRLTSLEDTCSSIAAVTADLYLKEFLEILQAWKPVDGESSVDDGSEREETASSPLVGEVPSGEGAP